MSLIEALENETIDKILVKFLFKSRNFLRNNSRKSYPIYKQKIYANSSEGVR